MEYTIGVPELTDDEWKALREKINATSKIINHALNVSRLRLQSADSSDSQKRKESESQQANQDLDCNQNFE